MREGRVCSLGVSEVSRKPPSGVRGWALRRSRLWAASFCLPSQPSKECPWDGGYDLSIGTSERGESLGLGRLPKFRPLTCRKPARPPQRQRLWFCKGTCCWLSVAWAASKRRVCGRRACPSEMNRFESLFTEGLAVKCSKTCWYFETLAKVLADAKSGYKADTDPTSLFSRYVNVCPRQMSRTIRSLAKMLVPPRARHEAVRRHACTHACLRR